VDRTIPYWLGPNESLDIGRDQGTPVSAAYAGAFPFSGRVDWVRIDLEPDGGTLPIEDYASLPRQ
jgi:hypothetical protein